MRLDSQNTFVAIGAPLSLVGGAGVAIPSPQIIDLLGSGVGTAPPSIIGNVTLFGQDPGSGKSFVSPEILVNLGSTAFTTANAATLNVALQYAPDTGAGGAYQPGAWQTVDESGPLTLAQLNAAITQGYPIFRTDIEPSFPPNLQPRYVRLLFSPAAGTNFTAGNIAFAGLVPSRDDNANRYAARNYTVQ